MNEHELYMRMALQEARKAGEAGEVPVGAVVVHERRVIGRGRNQTIALKDPTAHAEMLAITAAAGVLGDWRLENCALYATLEPCTMCGGAAVLARLPLVVFGAWDPKAGACGSVHDVLRVKKLNHQADSLPGVLEGECGSLLSDFFRQLRERRADERRLLADEGDSREER